MNIGAVLTLVGMAIMLLSLWEPRRGLEDFCDVAASLRHVYRLPRRTPEQHRDAINQLHTIN